MKHTINLCLILSLFKFGCNVGTDDQILETLKGTVVFTSEVAEMEKILLRNGKVQQVIKEDGKPWVIINEVNAEDQIVGGVVDKGCLDENNAVQLASGAYVLTFSLSHWEVLMMEK